MSATTATKAPTTSTASVTPVVVRLKLSLLRNGLRQSAGRRAVYVASLVIVLLFAALQLIGLIALRGNTHAMTVTVLLTAVLALGWAVMPLFFSGGDETLDPTRLVMLPLRPQPLVRALLVASLVGIGPLFTLCLLVGSVVAMAHGAAAYVTGVVAVVLALLVCVALARTIATANTRLLTSRKGRDLAVLSGLVIAVGAQVVNFGAQKLGSSGLSTLDPAADVVRWVPPASALGAVDSVSEGSYAVGLAQLALSGVALAVLLAFWQRSLTRLMTSPDGSTLQAAEPSRDKAGRSSGLGRLLPAGRTGTVMERSLRYVWRDPKTKAAWVTSLAIGLIVPVFNALQGTGSIYFACFAAGMLGIQMYNQFGQDTSAFWMVAMTISSTRDAYVELRARALALLVITLPYAVLVCVLTTALLGDWRSLPEVFGLSFALLGAMLATGAWSSARFPYSIPQESYKNVAPGQASLAGFSIFGGMIAAALLCAPVITLTIWLNVSSDGQDWTWLLLPIGTAYGAAIALAGLHLAAPRTARQLPEILAAVSKG
ncbi:ABC-2 type transport system permease protein [Streptomyces umbrinus]|uniref:ABC-2 type transport system permease protein n=1 Tax=Streptomyces umbrinus TaxID=67370 RepID=A0ABU0SUI4_9ACTN|nr:transporter [Streptomyces umbrinus]MDQ1027209.1 ABC-2 type transport system permease protein [Streptomyces umbrinus]